MSEVQTDTIGTAETETLIAGPETVYVATLVNPNGGNQITTAHRTAEGAEAHVDEMASLWAADRGDLAAEILPLPLMP